jgi:hypothetical protein
LGFTDAVKRSSENDFICHPTPHTTHPIRHGNTTTVSETGPIIAVGSVKAQGSKVKPVDGSEPPRATRAMDEVTQRMANIFGAPGAPSRGLGILQLVSESRLGGFLDAPLWAGI